MIQQSDNGAKKERVALSSIAASAAITVAKLVAGLLSGSLALISEAAHALVDTGATIVTYLAVRTANKPPDEEHHYGHGKFESMAALAETVVLFILATRRRHACLGSAQGRRRRIRANQPGIRGADRLDHRRHQPGASSSQGV
jgi:predicted Co/Zn/Cd cation transporter (cation efflux family)